MRNRKRATTSAPTISPSRTSESRRFRLAMPRNLPGSRWGSARRPMRRTTAGAITSHPMSSRRIGISRRCSRRPSTGFCWGATWRIRIDCRVAGGGPVPPVRAPNPILWKVCAAPAVAVALCSIGTVLGAAAGGAIVALILSLGLALWIGSTIVSRVRSAKAAADSIAGGTGAALAPAPDAGGFAGLDASLKRLGVEVVHIVDRLQAESARTAAILGSMVEGVLAVDEQLRITFCNGSFRRILGIGDGLMEGAPLRTVCRDSGLIDLVNRVLHSRKQAKKGCESMSMSGGSLTWERLTW